jgi:hypothetical protein
MYNKIANFIARFFQKTKKIGKLTHFEISDLNQKFLKKFAQIYLQLNIQTNSEVEIPNMIFLFF